MVTCIEVCIFEERAGSTDWPVINIMSAPSLCIRIAARAKELTLSFVTVEKKFPKLNLTTFLLGIFSSVFQTI